jgi:hypothetical protein
MEDDVKPPAHSRRGDGFHEFVLTETGPPFGLAEVNAALEAEDEEQLKSWLSINATNADRQEFPLRVPPCLSAAGNS